MVISKAKKYAKHCICEQLGIFLESDFANLMGIKNLYLNASFSARQTTNSISGAKTNNDLLLLGVAFGL